MNYIRKNRGFLLFLFLFGLFRTAVADWNPIPSGSMRPNILEGDVVLIDRLAYDVKIPLTDVIVTHLDDPQRGDIVTFSSPGDGTRMIKRVIALPGDIVEMRDKKLLINGKQESYAPIGKVIEQSEQYGLIEALQLNETRGLEQHTVQWIPGIISRDNFGPITLSRDYFFMLGDNRNNSGDSRYFGPVPRHLLIGKAERILISADIKGDWLPRLDRFGKPLN